NRTSSEVNAFERQASEAQARYKKLLEQWSRVYEELRAHYGASIDRVKPYFEAAQTFRYASERVQVVVREFSAAASQHSQAKAELRNIETRLAYGAHKVRLDRDQQDGLSRATVRVLRCRQERDRREQEYAESLREYEDAKAMLEDLKHKLGEALIKRYEPIFRQLQQHQLTLSAEQQRIASFSEKAA
ncbi:sh3bp5l, partial [Symbiodinium necroappetens]